MKKLRILKIYQEERVFEQKLELKGHNVIFSGNLYYLSNELSLFYWHGCPFKYLPSNFYPENIVVIDLSYSNIKDFWTTPKCFRRLKVMKLRYCCSLATTPDFSEITNLEELNLEGCVNLSAVHSSIGMLKKLVVLNLKDCTRVRSFPNKVEMDSLQVLNLLGCLSVNQLPEAFWSRWWTSIPGFIWNQQHPQRSLSLAGFHMLKDLNLGYCNLLEVPESIGGLSFLEYLNMEGNNLLEVPESIGCLSCLKVLFLNGNNFTSLPGSLSQLSHLQDLSIDGCKKLEMLPELHPSLLELNASDCISLREVSGSSKDPFWNRYNYFRNCPKLFKNVTIDSQGSISKTQCLDSSITSQGSIHQFSAFLGLLGFQTNKCEFFSQNVYFDLDIVFHGNSMPEWFTNRSTENHVGVELPSDSCFNKLRGFGTCVVFKRKKPRRFIGYSVKNFDGDALYINGSSYEFLELKKDESYMIWLHYMGVTRKWEERAITFCFEDEDIEVKECGARLVCEEDLQQDVTNLSILQDLPTLTHGASMSYSGPFGGKSIWSW